MNVAEKYKITAREVEIGKSIVSKIGLLERLFRRIYVNDAELQYCCGSRIKGNFRNSRREGLCVLRLSTGDYIKAEYMNGLRQGMGYSQFNDYGQYKMISFEGEYERDMKHGYGELVLDNGAIYNGQWQANLQYYGSFEGMGHKYMGYWKGKNMDIKGIYKTPDGKVYRGEIQNNKFVGEGEFIDQNQIIKGKFEDNLDLHEKGNRNFIQGKIINADMEYEGQIKDGKPHGFGTKVWLANGEVYEGYWENGIMHGEGTLKMEDLSVYSGGFLFGKFDGEGQIVRGDQSVTRGTFKNGVITGKGIFKFPPNNFEKKEEYVGEFLNGYPHGVGTLKFINGTIY